MPETVEAEKTQLTINQYIETDIATAMPRVPPWRRYLKKYIEKKSQYVTQRYVDEIERVNERFFTLLAETDRMRSNPKRLREEEIRFLVDNAFTGGNRNRRYQKSLLSGFLSYCGNDIFDHLPDIRFPEGERSVDWLSREEFILVYTKGCETAEEKMLIHLEGRMGLRRSECRRASVDGFDHRRQVLTVRRKGKYGGKIGDIPFAPDTVPVLNEYLQYRENFIEEHRSEAEEMEEIPDNLFLTHWGGSFHIRSRRSMDDMIYRICERTGIRFRHHTLRRTFGRLAWEAGVPVETIAGIYGHKNTAQTIKYIGVNLSHMREGMRQLDGYLFGASEGANRTAPRNVPKWR